MDRKKMIEDCPEEFEDRLIEIIAGLLQRMEHDSSEDIDFWRSLAEMRLEQEGWHYDGTGWVEDE